MTRLEEIKRRIEEATPGPWEWKCNYDHHKHFTQDEHKACENWEAGRVSLVSGPKAVCAEWAEYAGDAGLSVEDPDRALIANAPADLAYLLARLERAEGALELIAWFKGGRPPPVALARAYFEEYK